MTVKSDDPIPIFESVVATEYFDGPMAGIARRSRDNITLFFRIVAWDSEYWTRLFAMTPISEQIADRLRVAVLRIDTPTDPSSWAEVQSILEVINTNISTNTEWTLTECHSLYDATEEYQVPESLTTKVLRLVVEQVRLEFGEPPLLPEFLSGVESLSKRDQ